MNHELVDKMLDAFGIWPWERIGITRDQLRANMSAVLHVAADEITRTILEQRCERGTPWDRAVVACADAVRARLTAPAKTPEERVMTEHVSACDTFGWKVFADHDERGLFRTRVDANIYRLGLIATLKQEGAK